MSFHDFPVDTEIRDRWVRAIRRDEGPSFKILRGTTYVCSQHFAPEDLNTSASGRIRIRQGAVPSRFHWNDWGRGSQARESVYMRARKHLGAAGLDDSQEMPDLGDCTQEALPAGAVPKEHDYVCHPSPGKLEIQQLTVKKQQPLIFKFCITDEDSATTQNSAQRRSSLCFGSQFTLLHQGLCTGPRHSEQQKKHLVLSENFHSLMNYLCFSVALQLDLRRKSRHPSLRSVCPQLVTSS